ncbi:hypothetical protein DESPIGER_0218 [Desulfovibrio piger]|uniref:Uncharacterized protein n=1 Tax=Desulfovibrio piger TaxID=901 RepID=A0A1K1LBM4_9BACT|nr:hypothetical protein DESPIGER_0218 [Desulfovibrio piger]
MQFFISRHPSQDSRGGAATSACPPSFPYIFPPQPKLSGLYRGQPGTPPAKLRREGPAAGGSGRRAPRGWRHAKKTPSR